MTLLYEMGIDPGLEFIDAVKPVVMDEKTTFEELKALAQKHDLPSGKIMDAFAKKITRHQGRIFYQCPQKVALIHWIPDPAE